MKTSQTGIRTILLFMLASAFWLLPATASAHCDTLDGPVVATARLALEKGDVTPVLKWVKKENENEIRELFKKTIAVRNKGKEAKELADMYFFENLIRIHRAGEGAPYTGLKPAGQVEPSIAAADKAIETGSLDPLIKMITDASTEGIRARFNRVRETKKHADENVEAGREYVEAYVDFTHYIERLHADASIRGSHHNEAKSPSHHEHQ